MEQQAFNNTVLQFYPVYLRKAILKAIVDKGLVINNKKRDPKQIRLNLNDTLDVTDDESVDDKLTHALRNDEICAFIEEYEYQKAYKHFCYFKVEDVDIDKIRGLANKGKFIVFDRKRGQLIDDFSIPTIYSNGETIYLKFSYRLKNYEDVVIKYVMLAIIDTSNSVLEIRFDQVGLPFKDKATFYKTKIEKILSYLRKNFGFRIKNIDFKAIVDYINNADMDVSIIAQQMRRNGTTAYLQADEEDNTIPILGELDRFVEENQPLFLKNEDTQEIKRLLDDFRNDIRTKSDLPKVIIRIEDLNVKIGITHNYKGSDFSLFLLYGDLLQKKEVMDNVREFFMQCSRELDNLAPPIFIPGEEIS